MANDVYGSLYTPGFAADIARVIPVVLRSWLTRNALFPEKTSQDRKTLKYSFAELCALDVMSRATECGLSCYLGARIANTIRSEFQTAIDNYRAGRPLERTIAVLEIAPPEDDSDEFLTNTAGETPWVADGETLRLTIRRPDGHCRYAFGLAFAVDIIDVMDRVSNTITAATPRAIKLRPLITRKDAA